MLNNILLDLQPERQWNAGKIFYFFLFIKYFHSTFIQTESFIKEKGFGGLSPYCMPHLEKSIVDALILGGVPKIHIVKFKWYVKFSFKEM